MSDTESDSDIKPITNSHVDEEQPKKAESEQITTGNADSSDIKNTEEEVNKGAKDEPEQKTEEKKAESKDGSPSFGALKTRKRALDAPRTSAFSRNARNNTTQSTTPPATATPPPTSSSSFSFKRQTVKPSWIRDEELQRLQSPPVETKDPEPVQEPARERYGYQNRSPAPRAHSPHQSSYNGYRSRVERDRPDLTPEEIERDIARKKQNIDYVVRQHYNKRTFDSRTEHRESSPIIKLKNFNNAIKFILINESTRPGDRVLDLGCGKGGDINKYIMANVSEYVGIDISNASISEAVKRYRNSRAPFEVTFITGDCFGQPLPVVLAKTPHITFPFDVVSMQFCMHYAFESEQKVRTLLMNITKSLKPGGLFIGTIPSSDFIREKVKRLKPGVKHFGNSIYSVTFEKQPPPSGYFEETFGNAYNYYLKDAIDNVPEYVVPFESFRGLALEYGLKLRFKKSFNELFLEHIPVWRKKLGAGIMRHLQRSDRSLGIQGEEAEATAFYLAFEFVKVE